MIKVYHAYAEMFVAPKRNLEHFREMWHRALHMNAESGVSLVGLTIDLILTYTDYGSCSCFPPFHFKDPEWPKWNNHIKLMVGQELYRILYDHLTFNIHAVKPADSSNPPRQEAPVLFEVTSDNPSQARYEIRVGLK